MKNLELRKKTARYLLEQISKGFKTERELNATYDMIIKLYEGNFITKKDCRIITELLEEYGTDNFEI